MWSSYLSHLAKLYNLCCKTTLTSHVVKIFERIMTDQLIEYITDINAWNDNQHGFRTGRSCLSQLLEHHQKIIDGLENENMVDIIYLDFCKAFDKVDHEIVLRKLASLGVARKILKWIGDF